MTAEERAAKAHQHPGCTPADGWCLTCRESAAAIRAAEADALKRAAEVAHRSSVWAAKDIRALAREVSVEAVEVKRGGDVTCKQCGQRPVEEDRRKWATPVCTACLPPPRRSP